MKTIDFETVDLENGRWRYDSRSPCNYCLAIPIIVNSLNERLDKLVKGITNYISEGMQDTLYNRRIRTQTLTDKVTAIKEELFSHYYSISELLRKVDVYKKETSSPSIINLRNMENPLKKNTSVVSYSSDSDSRDNSRENSRDNSPDNSPSFSRKKTHSRNKSGHNSGNSSQNGSPKKQKTFPTISKSKNPSVSDKASLLTPQKGIFKSTYTPCDPRELTDLLESAKLKIDDLIDDLEIVKECWKETIALYDIRDATDLFMEMRDVSHKIHLLDNRYISAFFTFDDATLALVKTDTKINFNLGEALDKLLDFLYRNFLKCVNNYKNSSEAERITKTLDRLKSLKLKDCTKLLEELKVLIETEPHNYSLETCYKKFGEMHSNMRMKKFKFTTLEHLYPSFSPESIKGCYKMLESFEKFRGEFLKIEEGPLNFNKRESILDNILNRNISELEIYCQITEEMLLECDPGKAYFFLNNKLYGYRNLIAGKYYTYVPERLEKHLETLASPTFHEFITDMHRFILILRKERKLFERFKGTNGTIIPEKVKEDKYLDDLLASCGTFITNTLRVLTMEILKNLPVDHLLRSRILKNYEYIESRLKHLDGSTTESDKDKNDEEPLETVSEVTVDSD